MIIQVISECFKETCPCLQGKGEGEEQENRWPHLGTSTDASQGLKKKRKKSSNMNCCDYDVPEALETLSTMKLLK